MPIRHRRRPLRPETGPRLLMRPRRCMRVCTIFQRLRTKDAVAAQPRAVAVLVVKANTLVILQYVSRLHGPQLFMKAGPERLTSQYCPRVLHCAVHAATIATVEAELLHALTHCEPTRRLGTAGFLGQATRATHTRYVARPRISVVRPWERSPLIGLRLTTAAVQRRCTAPGTVLSVDGAES